MATIDMKVTSIDNIQKAQIRNLLSFPQILKITSASPVGSASNWMSKPLSSFSNHISHQIFDFYDLHFICSLCGKQGNKYSLQLKKEFVEELMKGVSITLQVVEFLGILVGLRIPHVNSVINNIFGEIPPLVRDGVKGMMKLKTSHVIRKGDSFEMNKEFLQATTGQHQRNIRSLLEMVEDPDASQSGLKLVSHDNNLVWACSDPDDECQQCRNDKIVDLSLGGWEELEENNETRHWTRREVAEK